MNLQEKVMRAGVIGAGGAGFPTHVKLDTKAEYLLLNAVECEPLLRVDQQLMESYTKEILQGFEEVRQHVGAEKAIIGIKEKHGTVIDKLKYYIEDLKLTDKILIHSMKDRYPAGDEQILVYEITGRIVPEGGIPIHVGCVVINSETALNVYNAWRNIPVTEKYVTVTGDIPTPFTAKVKVGTPLVDVLEHSGIRSFEDYEIIDGGPMMGNLIRDLTSPVTKKQKGFIILKKDHPLINKKSLSVEQKRRVNRSACEQCRMCTDLCPRYLIGHGIEPHKIMRGLHFNLESHGNYTSAMLCCQCNLCELYACPAGLHPSGANRYFKEKLLSDGQRYSSNKKEYKENKMRAYRLSPSKRLIQRLGLAKYDGKAPLMKEDFSVPRVTLLTSQHIGAPAKPVVSVGEQVAEGQLVADLPEKGLSARIHASINGIVEAVKEDRIVIRGEYND